MTVTASRTVLVVLHPELPDVQVSPYHFTKDGWFAASRGLLRELKGAHLIDPDCKVWRIVSIQVDGIASLEDHGSSIFFMVAGLLTFTSTRRAKAELEPMQQWDLPKVKQQVCDLIDKNPDVYTSEKPMRIKRLISTCKSVAAMGSVILGSPFPNDRED